jgi:hypothetical protein
VRGWGAGKFHLSSDSGITPLVKPKGRKALGISRGKKARGREADLLMHKSADLRHGEVWFVTSVAHVDHIRSLRRYNHLPSPAIPRAWELNMARNYLGGSGERLTVWISIAASTVLIFYGYDQGVFGNVIINENFLNTFGHPSANMQGVMTSIYNIGCFIGAMSTIWTGDILGRPRQIMIGSTIIGIGAIIQTCSWTVASMMVGRIVAGLGTGMNTATAGVWQAETSKMNSRGKLVIIQMGMSDSRSLRTHVIDDNQQIASLASVSRTGSRLVSPLHLAMSRGGSRSLSSSSSHFASTPCAHFFQTRHVSSYERVSMRRRWKS